MENIALVTIKVPLHPPPKPMKPSKPTATAKMVAMSVAAATQTIAAARASSTQSKSPSLGKGSSGDHPSLGVKVLSAGLAACWADLITFPLDTAKVRLQALKKMKLND